jgi:large subunit ribosomal protein L22
MSFAVRATARYIPLSPRKARLVIDLVRGRPVKEALATLKFTSRAASRPVSKVLASAVANAEENYGLEPDELYVAEIAADPGPILKRWRFGARGRYKPIAKRTCHISVALMEIEPTYFGAEGEDEEEVEVGS